MLVFSFGVGGFWVLLFCGGWVWDVFGFGCLGFGFEFGMGWFVSGLVWVWEWFCGFPGGCDFFWYFVVLCFGDWLVYVWGLVLGCGFC